jgi:uncharacterized surface protein with fasciclin (FAS1) repeats
MIATRLLTAAAAAALIAGAGAAWAQSPQTAQAKTQAQAQAATGRPTSDAPANTAVQGTAAAVRQGVAGAPPAAGAAPPAAAFTPITAHGDIIQTLQAAGQFTTLIKALDATNLTPVLKTHSNLTLFAPTDAAFAAYEPNAQLFADLTGLQHLLTHHLINAAVDSSKFKNAHGPVDSVAGDKIVLDGTTSTLKADNADIVQADIHASNGIIDVVDQVLKAGSVPATLPDQGAATGAAPPTAATAPEPSAPPPAKKKGTKKGD